MVVPCVMTTHLTKDKLHEIMAVPTLATEESELASDNPACSSISSMSGLKLSAILNGVMDMEDEVEERRMTKMKLAAEFFDPSSFEDLKTKRPRSIQVYDHTKVNPGSDANITQLLEPELAANIQLRNFNDYADMVQARSDDYRDKLLMTARNAVQVLGKRQRVTLFENATNARYVEKQYLGKPKKREIEVLKAMNHPNIPSLFYVYIRGDSTILEMEYCGEPLARYVEKYYNKNGYVPEPFIWNILQQMMDLLKYLEHAKVVHLNISGETICILHTRKGLCVKLVGFGHVLTYQDIVPQTEIQRTVVSGVVPQTEKQSTALLGVVPQSGMMSTVVPGVVPQSGIQSTALLGIVPQSGMMSTVVPGVVPQSGIQSTVVPGVVPQLGIQNTASLGGTVRYCEASQADDFAARAVTPSGTSLSGPQNSRPSCQEDMEACGRVTLYMVYGPGVLNTLKGNLKDLSKASIDKSFPERYSSDLKEFVKQMVGLDPQTGLKPATGLDIAQNKQSQEVIELSDSDEVVELSDSEESIELTDGDEVAVESSNGGVNTHPPISVSPQFRTPLQQRTFSFFGNGNSKQLPPIHSPQGNTSKLNIFAASSCVTLQHTSPSPSIVRAAGTVGSSVDRPDDVISVNPRSSRYKEPEISSNDRTPSQAHKGTLNKLRSHVTCKTGSRIKPYIREQKKFTNLPNFGKLE